MKARIKHIVAASLTVAILLAALIAVFEIDTIKSYTMSLFANEIIVEVPVADQEIIDLAESLQAENQQLLSEISLKIAQNENDALQIAQLKLDKMNLQSEIVNIEVLYNDTVDKLNKKTNALLDLQSRYDSNLLIIAEQTSAISELELLLETSSNSIASLRLELNDLESEFALTLESYNNALLEISTLESDIINLQQLLSDNIITIAEFETELQNKTLLIESLQSEKQTLLQSISLLELQISDLEALLSNSISDYEIIVNEVELQNVYIIQLVEDNEAYLSAISLLESNIIQLEEELQTSKDNLANALNELHNTTLELNNLELQFANKLQEIANLTSQLSIANQQLQQLTNDYNLLSSEFGEITALYDNLLSIVENYNLLYGDLKIVKFFVDDVLYDIQFTKSRLYEPYEPIGETQFLGWSDDGVNIISVENINITSDKNYYALFDEPERFEYYNVSIEAYVEEQYSLKYSTNGGITFHDGSYDNLLTFHYTDDVVIQIYSPFYDTENNWGWYLTVHTSYGSAWYEEPDFVDLRFSFDEPFLYEDTYDVYIELYWVDEPEAEEPESMMVTIEYLDWATEEITYSYEIEMGSSDNGIIHLLEDYFGGFGDVYDDFEMFLYNEYMTNYGSSRLYCSFNGGTYFAVHEPVCIEYYPFYDLQYITFTFGE